MGRRVDEGAFVVLAVNFHQRRTKRAQHLHADRLIVDEGAGAAIGELNAPHDQLVLAAKIVLGEHAARRMIGGKLESGGDLALLRAGAHQRRLAAGAERKRKGVEQDRFTRAGLAGQARQGRSRNRCPADRSERCREWRGGPASDNRMTEDG